MQENKQERLGSLPTHSLEGVVLPEAVVKDWKRRQQSLRGQAVKVRGGQRDSRGQLRSLQREVAVGQPTETIVGHGEEKMDLTTAAVAAGVRVQRPAAPTPLSVERRLHLIKKMVPADERGTWLLNNLLAQVRSSRAIVTAAINAVVVACWHHTHSH